MVPERDAKSVGSDTTYDEDLSRLEDLERELLAHAARVARRLTEQDLRCRIVRVKLKYADFQLRTRQRVLPEPVADTDSIAQAARTLLREFPRRRCGVRLVGVAAAELADQPQQTELFTRADDRRRDTLEKLSLSLAQRFGQAGVTRAALLPTREQAEARSRGTRSKNGISKPNPNATTRKER